MALVKHQPLATKNGLVIFKDWAYVVLSDKYTCFDATVELEGLGVEFEQASTSLQHGTNKTILTFTGLRNAVNTEESDSVRNLVDALYNQVGFYKTADMLRKAHDAADTLENELKALHGLEYLREYQLTGYLPSVESETFHNIIQATEL